MTEAEWFASSDSYRMVYSCRRVVLRQPRKGGLFAVACCRRIWHLLADERSRAAVEAAARFADALVVEEQLAEAEIVAEKAHVEAFRAKGKVGACAEWAARYAASRDSFFAATRASNFAFIAAGDSLEGGPEHSAQADLLRCIFGPLPFRSVAIEPTALLWNAGAVVKMAQSIYDDRAFGELPELADALEEAGCRDGDVLSHCRSPGPHVCGCWVVDLVLGK